MRIIRNCISEETAELATKNAIDLLDKDVWKNNRDTWDKSLLAGHSGKVLITKVDPEVRAAVLEDIQMELPYSNDLTMNYHVGLAESGIAMHGDDEHRFGATIYLNKVWHHDFGGIFLWCEDSDHLENLKGFVPEYRSLVINQDHENHMVTRVSPGLSEIRLTIQIFGH